MKKLVIAFSLILIIFAIGCQKSTPSYKHIEAKQLKQWLDNGKDIFLVDVHIPEQRHIKGTDAVIPFDQIKQNAAKFPKDKDATIVTYCAGGHMSQTASDYLIELGYKNVYSLDRGMSDWLQANYPLED